MADDNRSDQNGHFDRLVSDMGNSGYGDSTMASPPSGLFDRIENAASIPVVAAPTIVEYSIDCNDFVVSTGGDWARFAGENDGEDIAEEPPRLSLWTQIESGDARDVWQLVVGEVRRNDAAAKVPFRCDAPGMRRWYEVMLTPGDDGSIDFRSELVFEEPRPEVALVARNAQRNAAVEPIAVCCWCARGYDGRRWISLDELVWSRGALEDEPVPEVNQGICSQCASTMSSEADRLALH